MKNFIIKTFPVFLIAILFSKSSLSIECGEPVWDRETDAGVFVWQDCATGRYEARFSAGGALGAFQYGGTVVSDVPFIDGVNAVNQESTDSMVINDPQQFDFSLRLSSPWYDGFNFSLSDNTSGCFTIDWNGAGSAAIHVGPDRTLVESPFDVISAGACVTPPRRVSVSDVSVYESDTEAVFTVSLSSPSVMEVSVEVATVDGTALVDADYSSVSDLIYFQPGEIEKTVSVPLLQDTILEGVENFQLVLREPVNAVIEKVSGEAVINDDEQPSRPNILFIAVDDLRPDIGANGFSYAGSQNKKPVITPNINKLAKSGVRFSSAYSQVAVCSASRNSVMSGLRPESTHRWDYYSQLHWTENDEDRVNGDHYVIAAPDSHIPLAKHLQNNGYYTLSVGKVYHQPDVAYSSIQGWDELVLTTNRGAAKPLVRCKDANGSLHSPVAKSRCADGQMKVTSITHAFDYDSSDLQNITADQETTNRTIDFLDEFKSGNLANKQNFFFAVGFKKPHAPFISTTEKLSNYVMDDIKVPNPQPPKLAASIGLSLWGEMQSYYYTNPETTLIRSVSETDTEFTVSDVASLYMGEQIAIYDAYPKNAFQNIEYAIITGIDTAASTISVQRGYESTASIHKIDSVIANNKVLIGGPDDTKKVMAKTRTFLEEQDVSWLPELHTMVDSGVSSVSAYGMNNDKFIDPLENRHAIKDLRRHYWASISMIDDEIGKLVDYVENDPVLSKNTIVVLWSDHGYYLGEYGDWSKHTNGELATHVPLIVSTPETRQLEKTIDSAGGNSRASGRYQMVELVDIYPTIVELAGIPEPLNDINEPYLQGLSFSPLLEDGQEQALWKKYAFSQFTVKGFGSDRNKQVRGTSVRSDKWRYTEWRQLGEGTDENGNPTMKINTGRNVIGEYGDTLIVNSTNPDAGLVAEELYYEDEIIAYKNDPDIAPTPRNYAHPLFISKVVPDNYPAKAPSLESVIEEHRMKLKYAGRGGCTYDDLSCIRP